jgi:predicted RND superfamily exporter protein
MNTGRIIYRYLTALFVVDVLLQFFLAGAGVFSAGPGTAARDSNALDPHRFNGMIVMLLAVLLLVAALVARNGRWQWALALLVLTLLQPVLAIAGAAGGLHVLNAAIILMIGVTLAYRAWRAGRVQPPERTAQPAASRAASSSAVGEQH